METHNFKSVFYFGPPMPGQDDQDSGNVQRRRFLKGTGAGALAVGVAGCTEGGTDTPTDEPDDDDDTPTDEPEPDTPTDEASYGGVFTIGMNPPSGLNPLTANSAYSSLIFEQVFTGGTITHPSTFEVKPWIYTDWTVENTDSEQPDVYFNVDTEGITWTDGEEFTLDDVEFSYNFWLEQNPALWTSTLDTIDSIERADGDEWDFHITLAYPDAYWQSRALGGLYLLPEHIWSEVENPQNFRPEENDAMVGLGWGELTQFNADTSAEITFRSGEDGDWDITSRRDWLEEDELLRTGGPFIDQLRFEFFTSPDRVDRAILNGELDAKYGSIQAKNVQSARESDQVNLVPGADNGFGYVGYNLRRQPLDDTAFRQAMSFLWDDIYWIRRLNQNFALEGDFVVAPGFGRGAAYPPRPDGIEGAELLDDPRSNVFTFRGNSGVPDYEGIRSFLTEGKVVTGEGGTHVGKEYEGSFTGINAVQDEAMYDYSFGEVQSDVLQDAETNVEIRVNGQTIPELTGDALTYIMYPPGDAPQLVQMDEQFTRNMRRLGIPVERESQTFTSQIPRIYGSEDFDMYHMGWSTGSNAPLTLEGIFHSRNADDHTVAGDITGSDDAEENTSSITNNSYGYGLGENHGADDLIDEALQEFDPEARGEVTRQAVERIYLDHPVDVFSYDDVLWPTNSNFTGFLENLVAPGGAYFYGQLLNFYQDDG
jgi:peptide/nickel transport system substrate-binding protein